MKSSAKFGYPSQRRNRKRLGNA